MAEPAERIVRQDAVPARAGEGEHVRIGPISLLTLIAVICLAVLSALAFTTANASLTMAERQATATSELYLDEKAAQVFLAGIDDVLASARDGAAAPASASRTGDGSQADGSARSGEGARTGSSSQSAARSRSAARTRIDAEAAASLVAQSLIDIRRAAQLDTDGEVEIWASVNGNEVSAEFSCANGRTLNIVVTMQDGATYSIDQWKMSAVQNEEQPEGRLWTGE